MKKGNYFTKIFKTEKQRYIFYGALFGFCFPIVATFAEITHHELTFSLENVFKMHTSDLLLWLIDSAPFVIGCVASLAGAKQDMINKENIHLSLVAQNTDGLVVISNKTGAIEWVNDSFVRTTGYTSEEVIGTKGNMLTKRSKVNTQKLPKIFTEILKRKN